MEDQILEVLKQSTEPVPTLTIAKKVGKITTKEVNPTLYDLLKRKQVTKIAEENGRNPRWAIVP